MLLQFFGTYDGGGGMGGRNVGVYELALHDLKTEEKVSVHVQGYPQKMKL